MQSKPSEYTETPSARHDAAWTDGDEQTAAARRGSSRPPRRDWRLGGRAVRTWNRKLLTLWCILVAAGIVSALAIERWVRPPEGVLVQAPLWVSMAVVVGVAFRRARPAGLLRLRFSDVIWGIGLGLLLRSVQGSLSGADSLPFPGSGSGAFAQAPRWWMTDVLPTLIVGPFLEEAALRAVLLVTVFQLLRRSVGSLAAGLTALLVSAGAFVCLHAAFSPLTLSDGLQLFAVGATCALLVLLTGRFWGAVVVHIVYNATFLALVTMGSVLAAGGGSI